MSSYTVKKSENLKSNARDLTPSEIITIAMFLSQDGAKYDYRDMTMVEATKEVQKNIKFWINDINSSNLIKAFDTDYGTYIVNAKLNINTIVDTETNEEGIQVENELYKYLIKLNGKVISGDFDIIANPKDVMDINRVNEALKDLINQD